MMEFIDEYVLKRAWVSSNDASTFDFVIIIKKNLYIPTRMQRYLN